MKNHIAMLASLAVSLSLLPTLAQPGPGSGGPGGPQFGGPMSKLFGSNQTFSAGMEMQVTDKSGKPVTMPGKLSFDTGKSRFEFNMADMKGGNLPPEAAAQMKSMGMDQNVTISRPDKNLFYLILPGMQSYVEMPLPKGNRAPTDGDFKVETSELGKDTVDGHPCVKNKYVVTDNEGVKHTSTVWNATDLKNFPVKIQTTESGDEITMHFKNVSLAKPAASAFEAPAGYTKYDNMQALMQQQMMKAMGGAGGMPGGMGRPPGGQ
jgi:outer membrane lipoprotein-sorting protein